MLKSAYLFREELELKIIQTWYDMSNIYWDGSTNRYLPSLSEDSLRNNQHQFVSVDENNNLIGYISFYIDDITDTADQFGIISFDKGNLLFIDDLRSLIQMCFNKFNLNRVQFNCYTDNPAIDGYKLLVKRLGGRPNGIYHQCAKLLDGKLHDTMSFEIMREDYIKATFK